MRRTHAQAASRGCPTLALPAPLYGGRSRDIARAMAPPRAVHLRHPGRRPQVRMSMAALWAQETFPRTVAGVSICSTLTEDGTAANDCRRSRLTTGRNTAGSGSGSCRLTRLHWARDQPGRQAPRLSGERDDPTAHRDSPWYPPAPWINIGRH